MLDRAKPANLNELKISNDCGPDLPLAEPLDWQSGWAAPEYRIGA